MTAIRECLLHHVTLVSCLLGVACSVDSGSDGGQNTTSVLVCDEDCRLEEVGYALDDTLWLIWNQNFAGQPSGSQDKSVSCPLGGSAAVVGTTAVSSNGIDTIHLTLNLQACENSDVYYVLAFSGVVAWDGTFSSSSANALTFKSSALTINGTIRRYDNPAVNETCAVSLTDTYNKNLANESVWLNGEVCEQIVNL